MNPSTRGYFFPRRPSSHLYIRLAKKYTSSADEHVPPKKKKKRSKLFAFIESSSLPKRTSEQETEVFLHEGQMDELPLDYWARKSLEFPILSQVARKFLAIPATPARIERVFSVEGKILRTDRSRLLPRDFIVFKSKL